ncbi:thiol:disulfide interchange protein DsbC [Microbulbifer aestuariivivens]|uniref:Thiol:disulfide interchange protein n=1 Tax=Microbulbifer aestuariivivens TaxID=1908308 RepID=A0ABP9WL63_9GAMM
MKYLNKPLMLVGAVLALFGGVVQAEVDAETAAAIKAKLKAANPRASYGEVSESPIKGIYEVEAGGGNTLYVTGDASYFIFGDLYKVESDNFVNVAEQRRSRQRAQVMKALDLDDMIVFSPKKGKKKAHIYVFTDVDCGYCRKLHNDVPELNKRGIEVRYLAFPRTGLNTTGYRKLVTAWCADAPNETLSALKGPSRDFVALEVCEKNPVAEQYKLGSEVIGVQGTPTIVMEDGTVVPGYVPPDTLVKALGI